MKQPYNKDYFMQGYICAVVTMIELNRGVDTVTLELFKAGLGKYDLQKFRKAGVDEHDLNVLKKYRKQLQP